SIILYAGPIPRARIDYIRGVNSTFILRSLLVRGLISRNLDPEKQNTFLYAASTELIRHLGLDGLKSLSDFAKYREALSHMKINSHT
ncbi:MAG: SMC-Scp complex subunit ScpB, partial [bacterium]|nr:SMC-Scp complex subunit ScpB [bacterium]